MEGNVSLSDKSIYIKRLAIEGSTINSRIFTQGNLITVYFFVLHVNIGIG